VQKGIPSALIEGRWLRAANTWKATSKVAKLASDEARPAARRPGAKQQAPKQETRHAAVQPVPGQQAEPAPPAPQQAAGGKSTLRDRFVAEFKVDAWADPQTLQANPFMYKDKIVGIRSSFEQMVSSREGRFGQILLANVPASEFTTPGQAVVLAMKITGRKTAMVQGAEVSVPHGTFIGAYKCKQPNCGEFFD
jgi:hypothetical protein